ncbi:CRISPR-associated endonuclease Cas1 [Marinobacterium sp. D7]|uniref:CRISPR-associated endonuclease Cas4g/Cas1g n=1 Tax=Marinobacterium ramblicola TaxID=2849041 RepID=UPI001C2CD21A|nr:CRISPR-associated endonuclease Cas1 [Marinobacterium ramblicola]MBV1788005.1 CRISPR-associated endonuclease Cas1 [Marinobacterium ramblicola]
MSVTNPAPDLIPARMINEYVYCPRLAYLEWVQGEWRDNPDTETGRHAHRRVDKKSGKLPEPEDMDEEIVVHARSVTLSDMELGIIAKLDLIEGEGNRVTPVDYKKGKRPHIAAGVYDPERVQLCAQGLLLRKHGYEAEEGGIYYVGSKEHVRVPFDDTLVELTLAATDGLRKLWNEPLPPPPLEDSPKCPRCSLVSICLPDEVNWYRHLDEAPRPIAVREEDKMPLYVQAPFGTIRKKGEVLEIEANDEKCTARLNEISHLALFGNVHLTTPTLQTLMQREIPVTWHTQGGWYYGHAQGLGHKNVQLRIHQFGASFDAESSLKIARSLVRAKILNCRTLLRRNWRCNEESPEKALKQLKYYAASAPRAQEMATLLGIEGQAASIYFRAFSKMLSPEADATTFDFTRRNRRPPRDPINALLSYAYSILTRTWAATLHGVGFDPYVGFYHQPRPGRPALALDMMEPFRPLLADSAVLTAINNGEVGPKDFVQHGDQCGLTNNGRKAFMGTLERRLGQHVTHPFFGYRLSYRRLLELEARLLGRYLSGEIDHYIAFTTR